MKGGNGGFGGGGGAGYQGGSGGFGGGRGGTDYFQPGSGPPELEVERAYLGGGGLGAGGGVFVQSGGKLTIAGGVTDSGGYVRGGSGGYSGGAVGAGIASQGPLTIDFDPAAGATTTISDPIVDAGGPVSVDMEGQGTVVLSGANSYSGTTTVQSGTLEFTGGTSGLSGAINVDAGGTLDLTETGPFQLASNVNVAGTLEISGGALTLNGDLPGDGAIVDNSQLIVAGNTFTFNETLSGSGTVDFATSGTVTFDGGIASSVGVTVTSGTVDLTKTDAAAGTVNVKSGTLVLDASNAIGDNTITFTPGAGGVVQIGQVTGKITLVDGGTTVIVDQTTLPPVGNGVIATATSSGLVLSNGSASLNLQSGTVTLGASFIPRAITGKGSVIDWAPRCPRALMCPPPSA